MASAAQPFAEDDLSCPVCLQIFRHPVILSCSHTFCKDCWESISDLRCPVCKRRASKDPPCNLVLKNLCEAFVGSRPTQEAPPAAESELLCKLHNEKLKLFCLTDKHLACLVCRDSRSHAGHAFVPISEAVLDIEAELKSAQGLLLDKWKALKDDKEEWDRRLKHVKDQAQHAERRIREGFQRLRQFLDDEEQARIFALQREGEHKNGLIIQRIEALNREISTISQTVHEIQQRYAGDDISFLQNYKATLERSRAQYTKPDAHLVREVLLDVAKHTGNMEFNVWEKMKDVVIYSPVILDPNTANKHLVLFDDLTSVEYITEPQLLPDNVERFNVKPRLLGSQGLTSGTHVWELEIGDNPQWSLGVAVQSTSRKEYVARGYWRVYLHAGGYWASTPSMQTIGLRLKEKLCCLRVKLDLSKGNVSFFNAADDQHLHTFNHDFKEPVFPYIANYSNICPIRILPGKVDVNTTF